MARVLAILEYLDGSSRGLNISEIGRRLKIPTSSAHVIMRTLERLGYVRRTFAKPVYTRYTKNTITSPRAPSREIQEVRKLGYAFDDEEEEMGVRCVAVPVMERTGRFLAALSVTGTVAQIPSESIGLVVRNLTITASAMCTCG